VLLLWRARRLGLDRVEALAALLFIGLAFSSQRFIGPLAVVAAPYLARDVEEWVRARRWPAWTVAPWRRAALATATCVAIVTSGWILAPLRPGLYIAPNSAPVAACDFIAAHGVRGRAFNQFELGGYLLWRFWPDRSRLPFIDIHQIGTPQDRLLYVGASFDPQVWRDLDGRRHFDWALVKGSPRPGDSTLEILENDTTWAMVFDDPAAALFVKRGGAASAVADSFARRLHGAGQPGP
jgi:hypothetical protein